VPPFPFHFDKYRVLLLLKLNENFSAVPMKYSTNGAEREVNNVLDGK